MDIVYLRELKIPCTIGVWDWERRIKQIVVIDLDLAADVRAAARSDRLEGALDYKAVTKRLIEYVGESQFQLVETLAEHIAEIIRTEFTVPWVRVSINKKGAIRGASDVGVVIERGEKD
ncbi:MAG: dihydroneopterin aldolase [Acidiferrobacterales bacterium]